MAEYRWFKVYDFNSHGREPQAPFTVRTIDLDGKEVVLARNDKGYFAVDSKCPHAGYPLGHGKCLPDGSIMCPYHRYCFDLKTGREVTGQGEYVETYPVREDETGIFIGLKRKWWQLW